MPACLLAFAAFGGLASWKMAIELGTMGFFFAIPFTIVNCFILIGRQGRRQREVWAAHNYAWYRKTFPAHAHSNGRVSCRHCHGERLQVRNLMNRSFTRMHACAQCGETLYFSPERI